MTGSNRNPLEDSLRRLADQAERQTHPGEPSDVRRRGERRRTRRRQVVGAVTALVVLAIGGGVMVASLQGQGVLPAPPVGDPTAVPSPSATTRSITDANVVVPEDLPAPEQGSWQAATDIEAPARITACQTEGLDGLRAREVVIHPMRRITPGPGEAPLTFAAGLQFDDADAAEAAASTVHEWVDGCPDRLREAGEDIADRPEGWTQITNDLGKTQFREVVHGPAGTNETDGLYWESVGTAVVGDRLAITVDVVGPAMEYYYSLDPAEVEASGMPMHPQFAMLTAAALRLDDRVPSASPEPSPSATGGSSTPEPGDSPEPTPDASSSDGGDEPASLSDGQLPRPEDFAWHEGVTFGGYRVSEVDDLNISRCQADGTRVLGPSDTREVAVTHDEITAGAVVMAFPDAATADEAWQTLQTWAAECADTLAAKGTPALGVADPIDVPVDAGAAEYHSFTLGDEAEEERVFVDYGITRVENRIVLATFESVGQDYNWDSEPGGPVGQTYPMIRTLQNMNTRLAS